MSTQKKPSVKTLVILSLLTALYIVLERFLSINAWNMRIGFAFCALACAGILFGPVAGALVGALGDIIGMLLVPTGPYFPGFTLTAALTGLVYGLFLHGKQSVLRTVLAILVNQIALSLFLQTLWISITYGSPYRALLPVRITQVLVMIPLQFIVVFLFVRQLLPAVRRMIES